jgi:hypothetical protein
MRGGTVRNRRLLSTLLTSILVFATTGLLAGAGIASAAPAGAARFTCSGNIKHPGVLSGTYSDVVVRGLCVVNSGAAHVQRDLVVAPGAALLAAYARDRTTRGGSSGLTLGGDLTVLRGGTLILGCEAAHFACIDDPNQKNPTLDSSSSVGGDLIARHALGVIVHASTIGGNVVERGGGGGVSCASTGIFAAFKSPVYSDYEDNFVGGNMTITGLRSCWLGALRNNLRNSALVAGNTMADPDAMEVVSNTVRRSLSCFGNSPAVQYGDSVGTPNVVRRWATGECGFNVFQPNPAATKTTPAGPLTPISVRARHHHHHHHR